MVKKSGILLTITIIAQLLLFLFAFADLGGSEFEKWLNPEAAADLRQYTGDGKWGTAAGVFVQNVTIGGYSFLSFSVLSLFFLFFYLLHRKETSLALKRSRIFSQTQVRGESMDEKIFSPADTLIGADKALLWLEEKLFLEHDDNVALISDNEISGVGKTLIANIFAGRNRDRADFLRVRLGERSVIDAGIILLAELSADTGQVNSLMKLKEVLTASMRQSAGILILDDIDNDEASYLIPETTNWRVLATSRRKESVQEITNDLFPIEHFKPNESIELFQKLLGPSYKQESTQEYRKLANTLFNNPYGIRVAALCLKVSPEGADPSPLLNAVVVPEEDDAPIENEARQTLFQVLKYAVSLLSEKFPASRNILYDIALCPNGEINMDDFIDWQEKMGLSKNDIQEALKRAHELALLDTELVTSVSDGERKMISLQTPVLTLLRKSDDTERLNEFQGYIRETLSNIGLSEKQKGRLLSYLRHVILLQRENRYALETLYSDFFRDLFISKYLLWAYELGEDLLYHLDIKEDNDIYQAILGNQALLFKSWNMIDETFKVYKRQEEILEENNDMEGLFKCYGNQALLYRRIGRNEDALVLYRSQEKIALSMDDRSKLLQSLGNQAISLTSMERLSEALDLYRKQEELCEAGRDMECLSKNLGNQAVIQKTWGRYDDAIELHRREGELCRERGDQKGLALCYFNQANLLKTLGRIEEAVDLLKMEEEIREELEDLNGLSANYGSQAMIMSECGKLSQAVEFLRKQADVKNKLEDWAGARICYWNMGLILRELERHDEAIEQFRVSIEIGERLNDPEIDEDRNFLSTYESNPTR